MNVTRAGKVTALLIIISAIVGLQIAVILMHPTASDLVGVYGISGEVRSPTNSTFVSSSSVGASSSEGPPGTASSTSQAVTTQSQPPPPPPSTRTVTTSITVLQPQIIYAQDYTPIGMAIVTAVGIVGLAIMFLKRIR